MNSKRALVQAKTKRRSYTATVTTHGNAKKTGERLSKHRQKTKNGTGVSHRLVVVHVRRTCDCVLVGRVQDAH